MNPFQDIVFLKALLVVLLAAAIIDLHTYKIPNLITLPAVSGALIYYYGQHGLAGLLFSLSGLGIGLLLLIIPYMMGGLGGGDVKLLGVAGAFLGARAVVAAFLYIAIIGGIYAVFFVLLHRNQFQGFFKNMKVSFYEFVLTRKIPPGAGALCTGQPKLKYGLAISLGTGLYIIVQANGLKIL
ncbi:MAG: prepilin peptidase [Desulfobacteraceae bacterium]|nr:prepilin peptidase [Desulfobacteraceae bacterium]